MNLINCTSIIEKYIDNKELSQFDYMIFGEDKVEGIECNLKMRSIDAKEYYSGN